MIEKIDHVAITVPNIKKGVEWYTKYRKCKVKYQDNTWALIGFKNVDLALVLPNEHPPHIAFIDETIKDGTIHRDGSESIYDHDTFGNIIEKIKYPKKK